MKTETTPSHLPFEGNNLAFVGDPNIIVKYNISGGTVTDNTVTFELGSHNFTSEVDEVAVIGGFAIDAAIAANRADGGDVKVTLVTFFGKDRFTPVFEELLQQEGIEDVYRHQTDKVPNDKTNEMFTPGGGTFFQDKVYERDKAMHYEELAQVPDSICLTALNWPWAATYLETIEYTKENDVVLALSPGPSQLNDLELTQQTLDEIKEMHAEYKDVELSVVKDAFFDTLSAAQILLVNKQDAIRICVEAAKYHESGTVVGGETETTTLLRELSKLGPKIVSITDGEKGSFALDLDGSVYTISSAPTSSESPFISTGVNEAYTGTFMSSYLRGESVPDSMRSASINAAQVGHSPLTHGAMLKGSEIEEIIAADSSYQAQKI